MNTTSVLKLCLVVLLAALGTVTSCDFNELAPIVNTAKLSPKLSDYSIFAQRSTDLVPTKDYHVYDLATALFTDYAEKQRLLYLPPGTTLSFKENGLPDFPDSSMLVKTFYYYKDRKHPPAGKRLIETRILLNDNGQWNVGTYQWNESQTDAFLVENGADEPVSWLDKKGSQQSIVYHIPANAECTACHRSNNSIIPLGTKVRNLNIDVERNHTVMNQFDYFRQADLVNMVLPSKSNRLPNWQNPVYTLEQRARAYLDVNCSHCHTEEGYARDPRLFLDYERPYGDTRIDRRKEAIIRRMETTDKTIHMPKLGTTVLDSAGFDLIKTFIHSL